MATEEKKTGRPSDYKPEYAEQARKLCLLGHTDAELASFFEVTETTINNWKKAYPKFFESIKKGKEVADGEVAAKLFHRATGYEHPEDDIRSVDGSIVITPTVKHYPPDTAAAIFWLKNRQRDKWRDKQEVEHTGEVNLIQRIQEARKRARGE
ncbi:terminase [Cronobacter sakazakii]|uniref:terminase n=1 Tax=Cronobacter sakazakii TaxID=28141 RepID=UPI000CFDA783|nr:terminase [Cronobacter sakazakii]PQX38269.1 terminase [Cronobacter sakazakii]